MEMDKERRRSLSKIEGTVELSKSVNPLQPKATIKVRLRRLIRGNRSSVVSHHRDWTRKAKELRPIFARFGLPEQILTDNGPQLVSEEFQEFTRSNGIQHIKIAPYHPRSNGMAERFVQTFKTAMRKMVNEGGDINQKLANFLLVYRKTPQSTTMEAPAMLLMKRIPRSRIDLITPNLQTKVVKRQEKQKVQFDKRSREKEFKAQEKVWVRNYNGEKKWIPGIVKKKNRTSLIPSNSRT